MQFNYTNGKKTKYKVSIYSFNLDDASIFNEDGFESARKLFAEYIAKYGDKGVVMILMTTRERLDIAICQAKNN